MPEPTNALADYDLPDLDVPVPVAIAGGALLGGLAGFFFFTARGARARHDLAIVVDRIFDALDTALVSWANVQRRAAETRHAMGDRVERQPSSTGEGLS